MKGIKVNLGELDRVFNGGLNIKPKRTDTRNKFINMVNQIAEGKMPITKIPAENIRAQYAIDAPIKTRFTPGPYKI